MYVAQFPFAFEDLNNFKEHWLAMLYNFQQLVFFWWALVVMDFRKDDNTHEFSVI